jgi:hypothetical protein
MIQEKIIISETLLGQVEPPVLVVHAEEGEVFGDEG